ncbi:ribonuclease P protein component [Bombiscardovia apis]|uniref:ribonuclease P protein component n=1 Tax=Bombiscardovia apis TaxID=2932182 RepID=UPI00295571FE|nr:ribonuclease P protein component [Bombiscardovia apis]
MERLKSHREFTAVLRRRKRVSSRDIVLHLLTGDEAANNRRPSQDGSETRGRRMGLAVSKAVGKAVTRNRVKRRFRAVAARHEADLPQSCDLVIRAKPSAAHASFASLDMQVAKLFKDVALRANETHQHAPQHSQGVHKQQLQGSRQPTQQTGGQV